VKTSGGLMDRERQQGAEAGAGAGAGAELSFAGKRKGRVRDGAPS
jgi:hypothetical protein